MLRFVYIEEYLAWMVRGRSRTGIYHKLCIALSKDVEPICGPERTGDILYSDANIGRGKELSEHAPE